MNQLPKLKNANADKLLVEIAKYRAQAKLGKDGLSKAAEGVIEEAEKAPVAKQPLRIPETLRFKANPTSSDSSRKSEKPSPSTKGYKT